MKKKICLVTGGTGGHIYPALALADLWKKKEKETDVFFIGNDDRMEADLIPKSGYRFYGLHSSGLELSLLHRIKAVIQMGTSYLKARKILKEEKPSLVMGFGGYVSAPVLMAASQLGIPVMIHEQNSVVGKANRLVMDRAAGIAVCYEKAKEVFDPSRTRMIGNPRATLAVLSEPDEAYFRSLGLDPEKKTVLIMMGSLGSGTMHPLLKEALKETDPSLQIIYAAGKQNKIEPGDFPDHVKAVEFVDTMKIYRFLDGIICRAGATTLAEVCALGIPAIIIPSPFVANNHQYYNARMLSDKDAAVLIEEKDLSADTLSNAITRNFEDENRRKALAENARSMGFPDAGWDLIDFAGEVMAEKPAGR